MREAGVNLVSVGIFSWALLEPRRGRLRLRLARPGPRPAARRRHRGRPGHADRRRRRRGSRAATRRRCRSTRDGARARRRRPRRRFCPSSPGVPRARPRGIAERAGRALRRPPGAGAVARPQRVRRATSAHCYCDDVRRRVPRLAARALRRRSTRSTPRGARRSGASATATGTRSSRPGAAPTSVNPAQQLDFARFSSDELLRLLPRASATSCAGSRPDVPVTTNFMATNCTAHRLLGAGPREVDVVANDHYLQRRATPTTTSTSRWPPT